MKKLFRVFERDDYGRPTRYLGVFISDNEKEAREKAAKHFNSESIKTTGYFGAEEVTEESLNNEKIETLNIFLNENMGRFNIIK